MIQILGLRVYTTPEGKEKKFDAFFEQGWSAPSVQALLSDPDKYLAPIPPHERWNLYFTVADCTNKKREFLSSSTLAFDIDKIDISRMEAYAAVFCAAIGVQVEETAALFSGHGLQFFVGLQVPIVDKNFFEQHREHYRALTIAVNKALVAHKLPGVCDPSVFDHRRLMRLPCTENRKPNQPIATAKVLQAQLVPTLFDITHASGIPVVRKEDQIDKAEFARYPKVDNEAIFKGCQFLAYGKANPQDLSEPQWYAALSITARMQDGHKISHEISQAHPGYSVQETDLKIDQATTASGPRTCKSINQVWEGCRTCPHFEKIASPILLRSKDSIKTEHTGFHALVYNEELGRMIRGKPQFEDLRKFFERENLYVSQGRVCYVYRETHFIEFAPERLQNFAQSHFDPVADTKMVDEFKNLIHRTNLVGSDFWETTTNRRVNFKNGILDLATMQLSPHSREYGFRYCLPYEYDPTATAPIFEQFLDEVTGSKPSLKDILLEFIGYSLSGDECKAQKALLCSGWGANGKSTLIEVLTHLAGKDNCQNLFYTKLTEDYYKIKLQSTLFNISEETPARGTRDSSEFKNMVTGGMVMARGPYQAPVRFRMKAKLIFLCNEAPATNDTTDGFFRRFVLVPFNQKFTDEQGNRDPDMSSKLLRELPGIFNLAITAYHRLVKNKYRFTGSVEAAAELAEYQQSVDPVLSWYEEWVQLEDPETGCHTTVADLHASYTEYFDRFGFRRDLFQDVRWFSRKLKHLLPEYKKRTNDGKPRWLDGKTQRIVMGVKVPELSQNPYGV